MSEDSRRRLERNPLRILDSKDDGDKRINAGAPSYSDYLNATSRDFFDAVRRGLDALGIAYRISPKLVRGLDYYCHTAFEFVTTDLGAQGTVMGGGRYDGLIGLMGGPETPGVGWAAGIERLAMLIAEPAGVARPIAVIPIGEASEAAGAAPVGAAPPGRLRRRSGLFRQCRQAHEAGQQDRRAGRHPARRGRAEAQRRDAARPRCGRRRKRCRSRRSKSVSRGIAEPTGADLWLNSP